MIGFLTRHWLGTGSTLAVVAAVFAFAVLNPAAALKLASSLSGFVQDKARAAVEWARKPHDWWRIGCLTLGCLCALASFAAYDQHRTVIVVTRAAATDADACKRTIGEKDALLLTYQQQQAVFADAARREAAQLDAARQQSVEATAALKLAQDKAAASSRAWWAGYAKRPDTCKAAQEALDVACAEVKDY